MNTCVSEISRELGRKFFVRIGADLAEYGRKANYAGIVDTPTEQELTALLEKLLNRPASEEIFEYDSNINILAIRYANSDELQLNFCYAFSQANIHTKASVVDVARAYADVSEDMSPKDIQKFMNMVQWKWADRAGIYAPAVPSLERIAGEMAHLIVETLSGNYAHRSSGGFGVAFNYANQLLTMYFTLSAHVASVNTAEVLY